MFNEKEFCLKSAAEIGYNDIFGATWFISLPLTHISAAGTRS